jgi:predicted SnoaL-like aldol condensation-catalyzing enzyme
MCPVYFCDMHLNKHTALEFLHMVVGGKSREAFTTLVTPDFRHHNPWFKGDGPSLMKAMAEEADRNPGKLLEVQRALEDGDHVAVHSRLRERPEDSGLSVVHLFRFEGALIAEMWDVVMVPPSQLVNENGVF